MKALKYIILVLTILSCNYFAPKKNGFANDNCPLELKFFDSLIIFTKQEIILNPKHEISEKFKYLYFHGKENQHAGQRNIFRFSSCEIDSSLKIDYITVTYWNNNSHLIIIKNGDTLKKPSVIHTFLNLCYFSQNNLTKYYLRSALMQGWKIDNKYSKKTNDKIVYKLISRDSAEITMKYDMAMKEFQLTYENTKLKQLLLTAAL